MLDICTSDGFPDITGFMRKRFIDIAISIAGEKADVLELISRPPHLSCCIKHQSTYSPMPTLKVILELCSEFLAFLFYHYWKRCRFTLHRGSNFHLGGSLLKVSLYMVAAVNK